MIYIKQKNNISNVLMLPINILYATSLGPLVTRTMSNRKLATSINLMHIHYNIVPVNCFCSSVIDDFMVVHKLYA